MRATYTLPNEKIFVYVWGDMLDEERGFMREKIDLSILQEDGTWSKETQVTLCKDDGGIYFLRNNRKIYIKDFDFLTYEELVKKVKTAQDTKDGRYISRDVILASFLKESEKVRIRADLGCFTAITPFGFGLVGSETKSVICKLSDEKYKKKDWHYKITLTPVDDNLRMITPPENYYFNDFVSMLLTGRFELVLEGE